MRFSMRTPVWTRSISNFLDAVMLSTNVPWYVSQVKRPNRCSLKPIQIPKPPRRGTALVVAAGAVRHVRFRLFAFGDTLRP